MRHKIEPFAEQSDDDNESTQPESDRSNDGNDKENPTQPIICEVKEFESRYNLKGEEVLKEIGEKKSDENEDAEQISALRWYKYFDGSGSLTRAILKIFSPHIQAALRSVIKTYPGYSFAGEPVILEASTKSDALACFFHHRQELVKYMEELEDVSAKVDVQLALNFVDKVLKDYTERYKVHVTSSSDPVILYSDIWMLFKPGSLVVAGKEHTKRILRLVSCNFQPKTWCKDAYWNVIAESFAFTGKTYGYVTTDFEIRDFRGAKPVSNLIVHPLKLSEGQDLLREKQIIRGKKLCALVGMQHRGYKGEAVSIEHHREPTIWGGEDKYTSEIVQLTGRVVVDHTTFIEYRTDRDVAVRSSTRMDKDAITEQDYICSNHKVPGFALLDKKWCWFYIDYLEDIEWEEDAFDMLMLPSGQKRIVHALTKQQTSQNDTFDDMIKGKGRGCIFLLHGAPGIGKTFTVESVAEKIKRPLYVMMSGEFGSNVETVERNLRRVLSLVTKWRAVLLIDEADVFLEKRSAHDLTRNGLVSIFLRTLEYFEGIMFLTTNRVDTFDVAFQSRIHLALKYHPLGLQDRTALWRLFLERTNGYQDVNWPEETLNEFAKVELNGRQIKNTVRTANTLALTEDKILSLEEINVVLETVVEFERSLLSS